MIILEQDHRWIIAIYKENTLRETKERLSNRKDLKRLQKIIRGQKHQEERLLERELPSKSD